MGGRAERVVREPMLIHAFNRLLPEQGGPVSGSVMWYPASPRRPVTVVTDDLLLLRLLVDASELDPEPLRRRAAQLIGLATKGALPGDLLARGRAEIAASEHPGEHVISVVVDDDDQQVLADWTGKRLDAITFSVVAGVASTMVFLDPMSEQVAWACREPWTAEQAAQLATLRPLQVPIPVSPGYTHTELAWIRTCDDRLQEAVRKRSDITLVGSSPARDRSEGENEGTALVAGVVIRVLDSQGTRRGIVVPSLWQCCLGRPPKQDQCLLIRWPDDVEGEAAAFPAMFRLERDELAVAGPAQEVLVSELQVLR